MAPVKDLLEAVERVRKKAKNRESSETYESCTKTIYEPCRLHPVDCENCVQGAGCRQREVMQTHPDKIKSCRAFRPKTGT